LTISIAEVKYLSSQLGIKSELRPAALGVDAWVALFKKFREQK